MRCAAPLVLLILASPAGAGSDDFAHCDAQFAQQPDTEEPARCFEETGSALGKREAAAQRLRSLLAERPTDAWLHLYLGHLDSDRAETLYRRAAEQFAARREARGEVLARSNLQRILSGQGKLEEAENEVHKATAVAQASGDKALLARAQIVEARFLLQISKNVEVAYRLLNRTRPLVFPDGSYHLKRDCLLWLAAAALDLGRYGEAAATYRQLGELTVGRGDPRMEAAARYGMARVVVEAAPELPREADRREAARLLSEALAAAERAGNRDIVSLSHLLLGRLTRGREAEEHFHRCLATASNQHHSAYCSNGLARELAGRDPAAAEEAIERSMRYAREAEDPWLSALCWRERMRVSWAAGSHEQAVADSFAALDTIEALRAQQPASASQAAMFSPWTEDYYWFSGQLLDRFGRSQQPEDLAAALDATERMRARTLADALDRTTQHASLTSISRSLAPDEAILSFQLAPWEDLRGDPAGGSWLLVIQRNGSRVYRLEGRGPLRSAVRVFSGLLRRGGDVNAAAAQLHKQVFGPALAELPPGVTKLILIPDDALHQLPFAALREASSAPPLGSRYELTLAPSVSLWLHWRSQNDTRSLAPALVLADPPAKSGKRTAAAERNGEADLGPLPYARRESRAVVRWIGSGSVRRVGEEATEQLVKSVDLARFGILHFAAHAVTDESSPERSGIVLAPGDSKEDGLLHTGEIAALPLGGKLVVLSACRTNAGTVLRGEGVMSLARAFFQGGAQAVVASLWPLRDEATARFFDRFYRHLSRGLSLSAALKATQSESLEAGVPATDWAGVVVLGRGDLVPIPGGRSIPPPLALWIAAVLGTALLLYLFLRWRRQTAK